MWVEPLCIYSDSVLWHIHVVEMSKELHWETKNLWEG